MSAAAEFPDAPFYIKAAHTGFVLQPAMVLKQEYCRIVCAKQVFGRGAAHQLWRHDNGQLINVGSGLALDYEGGNFAKLGVISVCQWTRKMGKDAHNQRWLVRDGGLIASHDDYSRVLDVRGASTAIGAEILLYKLKKEAGPEGDNQRFTFEVPLSASAPSTPALDETAGPFDADARPLPSRVQLPHDAMESYYDKPDA